jgi:LPS O-antigen subunit length determinant protein (WzzB/FepE family)
MINNKKISSETAEFDYSGSDLFQLFEFLRLNFFTLALCVALGVAGGIVIFAYLPYKWVADVTVQVGKVPFLEALDYVEPPDQVMEEVRSPLFLETVAVDLYGSPALPHSAVSELVYKDLRTSASKDGGLITFHVFGRTPQEAYKAAGVLGDKVVDRYQKRAKPYITNLKQRLTEATEQLAASRAVLSKVHASDKASPARTDSNALLKLAMIDAKMTEIQKLQMEQSRLQSLLTASSLHETKIVGRSLLPQTPVSPSRGLILLAGAFVGVLLGVIISLVRTVRRSI